MAQASKVTAFVLDESVSAGADGAHIPGVPGLWFHDRPTLAVAVGYTVQELREAIAELGLPLAEVKVGERSAHDTFPENPDRLPSGPGKLGAAQIESNALDVNEPDPSILDATFNKSVEIEEQQLEESSG